MSLDAATGDWFIYLDADEVLVREDAGRLRALAGHVWREAFFLVETNFTGDLDDGMAVNHNTLRMFRNRPEYRFKGRIHEQIAHALPANMPERHGAAAVRIEHYGYLGAVRDAKEKSRRNIELLEQPGADGRDVAFLCFNLGSEYAAAGDATAALDQFQEAWELLSEDPERTAYGFAPSLDERLVKALRATGAHRRTRSRARGRGSSCSPASPTWCSSRRTAPGSTATWTRRARLWSRPRDGRRARAATRRWWAAARTWRWSCSADIRRDQGDRRVRAPARGEPERASRLPGCGAPARGVMLARRGARGWSERSSRSSTNSPPSARFMLGTALYEAALPEAAEAQFRAVLDQQPRSDAARVALAETLLVAVALRGGGRHDRRRGRPQPLRSGRPPQRAVRGHPLRRSEPRVGPRPGCRGMLGRRGRSCSAPGTPFVPARRCRPRCRWRPPRC